MEYENFLDKLNNSRIVVAGLGKSGLAAMELLKCKGYDVIGIDSKQREDSYLEIKDKDIVVVSPGIKPSSKIFDRIRELKLFVISELDIAAMFCKAPIIAVTGSNGKSTVVTIVGEILKASGKNTWVLGNIGVPFSEKVSQIQDDDIVVCEVSSFQLENSHFFHPYIAVVLNIHQNHLDWHKDMNEYIQAKMKITQNLTDKDYLVLNEDDPELSRFVNSTQAKTLFFNPRQEQDIDYPNLPGPHHLGNFVVSGLLTQLLGVDRDIIREVLLGFKGLPHRFQHILTIEGINFINDSKSTTIGATKAGLESYSNDVVLIAGGRNKGSDFNQIKDVVREKVKCLVLIGESSNLLNDIFREVTKIDKASSMDDAVSKAFQYGKNFNADVVLSPMCASFDMFDNFEHRGDVFSDLVRKLK